MNSVKYLRSLGCEDIEFSPEDAGRTEPEFLYRVLEAVIQAGATTLNIPDTVSILPTCLHLPSNNTCLLSETTSSGVSATLFRWSSQKVVCWRACHFILVGYTSTRQHSAECRAHPWGLDESYLPVSSSHPLYNRPPDFQLQLCCRSVGACLMNLEAR